MADLDELARRFTHHAPTDDQAGRDRIAQHERVRAAGLAFAQLLADLTPDCPERARALDAVDDAVMRANAAIARPAPTLRISSITAGKFATGVLGFDPARFT